jgi:hypothetical protein
MKPKLIHIGFAYMFLNANGFAQLVSVRCCVVEEDLLRIDECVSGPGNTQTPPGCGPAGTCVLGFTGTTKLPPGLCDPVQTEIPEKPQRAICTSWTDESAPVAQECVAAGAAGNNLLTVFDADGDGDLDDEDLEVFWQGFQPFPNQVQSDARLVYVECCYPEAVLRTIQCLSGPGVPYSPQACDSEAMCTLGFSDTIEPGDYLYHLCSPDPTTVPDPSGSFCSSWSTDVVEIAQVCRAAHTSGIAPFVVLDEDGDGDLDLADFAVLQRGFEFPP